MPPFAPGRKAKGSARKRGERMNSPRLDLHQRLSACVAWAYAARPEQAKGRTARERKKDTGPLRACTGKRLSAGHENAKKGALLPTCSAIPFAVYVGKKYALKGSYRCARPREESPVAPLAGSVD